MNKTAKCINVCIKTVKCNLHASQSLLKYVKWQKTWLQFHMTFGYVIGANTVLTSYSKEQNQKYLGKVAKSVNGTCYKE